MATAEPETVSTVDPGADLACWASTGDRQALERALAAAADPAYAQAFRLLGRAADADDATQEALVQLARSARRYDPSRPFRPWLAKLVHDACCRLLRSTQRRRRHEGEAPPPPPQRDVDLDAIRAAVQDLPESLRAAVDLHYFAGLSQAEAAVELGIGEGACAMRLLRAREQLKGLLSRHGVGATSAAALVLLAATPAHAAPPALAAQIAAKAATGTLPTTTIPLTTVQIGVWYMSSHPITTGCIAALLVLAALLQLTMPASEAKPDAPPPPLIVAPTRAWEGVAAKGLLPYLDSKADFQFAADLEYLRPILAKTKPFSLLGDPKAAAMMATLRKHAVAGLQGQHVTTYLDGTTSTATADDPITIKIEDKEGKEVELKVPFQLDADYNKPLGLILGDNTRAATLSIESDITSVRRSLQQRSLFALDLGIGADLYQRTHADRVHAQERANAETRRILAGLSARGINVEFTLYVYGNMSATHEAQVGSLQWIPANYDFFCGRDNERFVFSDAAYLRQRIEATPAPAPPSPIWFSCNAGPLVARYAELAGPTADPAHIGDLLGRRWRNLRPLIEGQVDVVGGELQGQVHISKALPFALPFSPLLPLILANWSKQENKVIDRLTTASVRRPTARWPTVAIPASADRVAALTIGLDMSRAGSGMVPPINWDEMMRFVWSGDLAVEVRAAAPLPKVAMVFGLWPDIDGNKIMAVIGRQHQVAPQRHDYTYTAEPRPMLTWWTPAGKVEVVAYRDRWVATLNADHAEWPGIATTLSPVDASACSLEVDTPAVLRTWGPLLLAQLPEDIRRGMPPLPVLIEHLPKWTMTWDATRDGIEVSERGLPLATILTCAAAMRTVAEANPIAESEPVTPVQEPKSTPPTF